MKKHNLLFLTIAYLALVLVLTACSSKSDTKK